MLSIFVHCFPLLSITNTKYKYKIQIQNTNTKYKYKIQIQSTNTKYKYKYKYQIQLTEEIQIQWLKDNTSKKTILGKGRLAHPRLDNYGDGDNYEQYLAQPRLALAEAEVKIPMSQ